MAVGARAAEAPIPTLTARVTDLTHTLGAKTQASLTQKLAALEQSKGSQIAVLIVPTTGTTTIEQYATHVFDQWKLGRKKIDDGILLVVAKDDHHLRIEVGYGLEGAVPDILAGRIIREQIAPRFKQGDYAGGVTAGVDSLIKLVNGEALPPVVPHATQASTDHSPSLGMILPLAFMALVLPATIAAFAAALFGYLIFHSLGLAILAAVGAFALSSIGRQMRAGGQGSAGRASRAGGIIGSLGGLGGFGGGGFGGGGGGFGGGGGGSGGGGASGGW
ncbi:MAG: YgcG family protein [Candidimonas sp.]|nr:MAG: YgcG family protein [Candidimonas sp.]TAM20081.1 MAG: YgcG family protein [Candidimonas sp.]TAM77159.1 MAG: YgcG family protein [Candidimonas sp.]